MHSERVGGGVHALYLSKAATNIVLKKHCSQPHSQGTNAVNSSLNGLLFLGDTCLGIRVSCAMNGATSYSPHLTLRCLVQSIPIVDGINGLVPSFFCPLDCLGGM